MKDQIGVYEDGRRCSKKNDSCQSYSHVLCNQKWENKSNENVILEFDGQGPINGIIPFVFGERNGINDVVKNAGDFYCKCFVVFQTEQKTNEQNSNHRSDIRNFNTHPSFG